MRFSRLCRFILRGVVLGSMSLASAALLASAPANDLCQGAIVVPGAGPFPYLTPITTNINEATTSGDPAPAGCGVTADVLTSGGIWYAFTPAACGVYHLSVSDDTATTVNDTFMGIYRSSSGCAGPFTPVACNDDQGSLKSAIAISLNANTAYFVVVWAAYDPPSADSASVQLRVSLPTVPPNDTCAGAEVIPAAGPFPYLTQITDTSLATTSGDPAKPACTTNVFASSVWYRFTPAASRSYVISTCDDTRTTVYDTMLAVYTSASGNCGGALTEVACSDIYDRRAVITNAFTAGTTYFVVAGDASNEGVTPGETLMQLRIFEPRAPEVNPASSLTGTSAVLNATIPNFNTARLMAWFEWGETLGYGSVTPAQSVITGTNDFRISAFISGLHSGETHHYRLVVSNSCFGVMRSADQFFHWSSVRPTLTWSIDGGKLRLQFMGNPGQQYTVFSASAPVGLQPTAAATDLGNGAFEYIDPNLLTTRSRFFQIRSP